MLLFVYSVRGKSCYSFNDLFLVQNVIKMLTDILLLVLTINVLLELSVM
jgi:hypothetical protein